MTLSPNFGMSLASMTDTLLRTLETDSDGLLSPKIYLKSDKHIQVPQLCVPGRLPADKSFGCAVDMLHNNIMKIMKHIPW